MIHVERRTFPVAGLTVRSAGEGADGGPALRTIVGHAAVFDALSDDLGGFREKIAPGAFADSLGRDDIRALWNHDPNYVLGRNRSGTLQLREDETGLLVAITPPDTQWARDLVVSITRGDVSQMSFAFATERDAWAKVAGVWERTLLAVRTFDVSPVTYPAYTQTDVGVRAREAGAWRPTPPDDWQIHNRRSRLALAETE